MKVVKVNKITVADTHVYDVVQSTPHHNFIIYGERGYYISHNCGLL